MTEPELRLRVAWMKTANQRISAFANQPIDSEAKAGKFSNTRRQTEEAKIQQRQTLFSCDGRKLRRFPLLANRSPVLVPTAREERLREQTALVARRCERNQHLRSERVALADLVVAHEHGQCIA